MPLLLTLLLMGDALVGCRDHPSPPDAASGRAAFEVMIRLRATIR